MATKAEVAKENEIIDTMALCSYDALKFIMFAFPWGEKGTELEKFPDGPDEWHRDMFCEMATVAAANHKRYHNGEDQEVFRASIASGHGIGKGIRLCSEYKRPIIDSHSKEVIGMKSTTWGEVSVGDYVFSSNGEPTQVVGLQHYRLEHYRVKFDDGSFVDVSGEHEWAVRGRQERRKKVDGWRIMETQQIIEAGVKRPNGASMARQWEIPIQGAVKFAEAEQPCHPYFMGLWLGDGSRDEPRYTKPYQELADRLSEVSGYTLTKCADNKSYYVRGIHSLVKSNSFFDVASNERYIPDIYKYASIEQRKELFRGLCDSDGEVHRSGSIGYSSVSKQLVEDIIWLARSLGCKAMMQPTVKKPFYYDDDGNKVLGQLCYRATINCTWNPFTLQHRKDAYKPSEERYTKRWIDSIESIGMHDGMCIEVEAEDHLYQTEDFIVTHNSACVAWLVLWLMSTRPQCKGIVTANTATQLETKTWAELSKWHKLAINAHWFKLTARKIVHIDDPENWKTDCVPWSEENSEAFAGNHKADSSPFYIFDEASGIPKIIWEVAEGGLTDGEPFWFAFGNPTQNSGPFFDCFHKMRHRWYNQRVDSRDVRITNKKVIADWAEDYGEDSDFFKVRVRGMFPSMGDAQFIDTETVNQAMARQHDEDIGAGLIMAVDVARFGTDKSVIGLREGRRLPKELIWRYKGVDLMTLVGYVSEKIDKYNPEQVFIDETGLGGGVVDRLKQLGYNVMGINFSSKADDEKKWGNKRAEMWGRMRDWLKDGDIPDDDILMGDLISPEYKFDARNRTLLESKEDMKKRGLESPDDGDMLALTFAQRVASKDLTASKKRRSGVQYADSEYEIF